jgi:cytochrome P450
MRPSGNNFHHRIHSWFLVISWMILNIPVISASLDERLKENLDLSKIHVAQVILTIIVAILVGRLLSAVLSYQWILSESRLGMPVMHAPAEGRPLPFLGHALQFLKHRPWDLLARWHRLYGPIVCFRLLGHTNFSIASPALAKVVLQSKIASVKKDISNTMKPFLVILGSGIVTSEGEAWMKQRLKMSHPLRRDVLEMIPRQTLRAVQVLLEPMDEASQTGQPIALGASLRRLTLQVISGTFLSLSAEESDSTFALYYLPIVDEANARVWLPHRSYLLFLPAWWKQIYNVYRLNTYVSKLIRERWVCRRKEDCSSSSCTREQDILDRLLQVYEKEYGKCHLPASHVQQLRDEMKTFMLAGHETSAAMMTWALYEIMANDKLLSELRKEGDSVFDPQTNWRIAKEDEIPDANSLAKLVLSEAALRVSAGSAAFNC